MASAIVKYRSLSESCVLLRERTLAVSLRPVAGRGLGFWKLEMALSSLIQALTTEFDIIYNYKMKFTHYLHRNMVPSWVKFYLNFKLLKTSLQISNRVKILLLSAKKTKSSREYRLIKQKVLQSGFLMDKLNNDNQIFIDNFRDELTKVDNFIFWKYNDLKTKFQKIQQQFKVMRLIQHQVRELRTSFKRGPSWEELFKTKPGKAQLGLMTKKYKTCKNQLRESCYQFYQETLLFQSFVELNAEAIRKILKKYKKQMLKGIRKQKDESQNFGALLKRVNLSIITNKVKLLLFDIEQQMIMSFYPYNPKICRQNLRKYSSQNEIKKYNIFSIGVFCGYLTVFLLIILVLRYDGSLDADPDPNQNKVFNQIFPCFRGMILFLVYYWFLAFDVLLWNYFGISYKVYLAFNYHFSTPVDIIKRASILSTIFLIVFVAYILISLGLLKYEKDWGLESYAKFLPIICWVLGALYVFVPTKKYFNGQGRRWMYRTAWGALAGHFWKYESRFTFFTDQFVSMVTPLRDLDYTICYYYSLFIYDIEPTTQCNYQHRISALLPSIVPYSMKCIQYITRARDKGAFWNTDEMWNFFKTLLAVQVGWLSYLSKQYEDAKYIWIPVAVCSSLWQYWWDLKKDWLFFEPDSKHKFLRNDLGYNSPSIYYFIAVANLLLRGTWVLSISPTMSQQLFGIQNYQLYVLVVGTLEMTRRFMNNFLKIEKEHITNLSSLKSVSDYKYPFDVKILNRIEEEEELHEQQSVWSVSTLNRDSYIQEASAIPVPVKAEDHQISFDRANDAKSLTMEQIKRSIGPPNYIPFTHSTQRAVDRSGLLEYPKRSSDSMSVGQNFRLTDIIQPNDKKMKMKMAQTLVEDADMNIINQAKKVEKFQPEKTKEMKKQNQYFYHFLDQIYEHHNISKETDE